MPIPTVSSSRPVFVLDGRDGQPVVPPGNYIIRISVNPPFVPVAGEACPNTDIQGFCHQLPESDYTNNSVSVSITIPDRPSKTGFGPAAGAVVQADEHGDKVKAKSAGSLFY